MVPWEHRLEALKQYKAEHGDCNVPQKYSKNKSLGEWVRTQRKQYTLYVKGESSFMTRSRALALQNSWIQMEYRFCAQVKHT